MTRSEAVEVFAELFALTQDYAPVWYSEELNERAEAALQALQSFGSEAQTRRAHPRQRL